MSEIPADLRSEYIHQADPFTVRRRVKWGECDAVGVVWAVNYAEYATSATELLLWALLGMSPERSRQELGIRTPYKVIHLEYHSSLRTDEEFDMRVRVEHVGNTSFAFSVAGEKQARPVFDASLTLVCVGGQWGKTTPIPGALRAALAKAG